MTARLVVLVSGAGTNLQALLDATADPGFGAQVVAVGADRDGIVALERARRHTVPTFVCRLADYPDREGWDRGLAELIGGYQPTLVVSAGFAKLFGEHVLHRFAGMLINSHPSLLPSFPGLRAPRDAIDYGVKVTGVTVFMVDAGVDSGPVIAQAAVPVVDGDDEETLHERIKSVERGLVVDTVRRMVQDGFRVEGRKVLIG